jgi:hypothetical protein
VGMGPVCSAYLLHLLVSLEPRPLQGLKQEVVGPGLCPERPQVTKWRILQG